MQKMNESMGVRVVGNPARDHQIYRRPGSRLRKFSHCLVHGSNLYALVIEGERQLSDKRGIFTEIDGVERSSQLYFGRLLIGSCGRVECACSRFRLVAQQTGWN